MLLRNPAFLSGSHALFILALGIAFFYPPSTHAARTKLRSVLRVPTVSAPLFVVDPSLSASKSALPSRVSLQASNNNVAIAIYGGRLFMAFRSAPTHFASRETRLWIVSSRDGGQHFDFEHSITMGRDLREPSFLEVDGQLYLYYLILGENPLSFDPYQTVRIARVSEGRWEGEMAVGAPGEIFWEMKKRGGSFWATSYAGNHMHGGAPEIRTFFRKSRDGLHWSAPERGTDGVVYTGGWSEAGFEFDDDGNLWSVTRNEDGDSSGWGSNLAQAFARTLGHWTYAPQSNPERYDSPRMFNHAGEIYLIARRDIGGPFDQGRRDLSFTAQKLLYLTQYSLRAKRTALFRLDRVSRKLVHLVDLPGSGDTAFPSIAPLGNGRFLVANYTSPLDEPNQSWIGGQLSLRGTRIYLTTLQF